LTIGIGIDDDGAALVPIWSIDPKVIFFPPDTGLNIPKIFGAFSSSGALALNPADLLFVGLTCVQILPDWFALFFCQ
jgi:hypothetical protein